VSELADETQEGAWEFLATNGCAICNALEGGYEEEPARPHPHCECEVVLTTQVDRYGNGWYLDYQGGEFGYDPARGDAHIFTNHFKLYVECCDGKPFDTDFDYVGDTPIGDKAVDDYFDSTASHHAGPFVTFRQALGRVTGSPLYECARSLSRHGDRVRGFAQCGGSGSGWECLSGSASPRRAPRGLRAISMPVGRRSSRAP
jgi:hypothetical protein